MRGRRRNVGLSSLRLVCNDRIFAERRASLTSCLLTNHRSARSHSTTNTSPATCSATSHGNSSSVTFVSPLKDRFGSFEEEVQKWDPAIDVSLAPTPPSSWYISPEFLQKEASAIFHNNWLKGTLSFTRFIAYVNLSRPERRGRQSRGLHNRRDFGRAVHCGKRGRWAVESVLQRMPPSRL